MDHYRRSALNYYAANPIDRSTAKRSDEAWLKEQLKHPDSLFVPVWDSKQLFADESAPQPVLLSFSEMGELLNSTDSLVFLGRNEGKTYFAVDLPRDKSDFAEILARFGKFHDLKRFGALLRAPQAALLAYARALTHWHRRHRFCGDCGTPTVSVDGGHRRVCTNAQCGQQHFPRTDPAIITLVRSGERCLLGRQPVWPQGFYSAIAGFVEPGESLEDAVVREIREETGIRVNEVQYHSSQPWPYPGSIMLGFSAEALGESIRLMDHELEDARWFTRQDFQDGLAAGVLRLPSSFSIAFRLIEDWYDGAGSTPLRALLDSITDYRQVVLGRS
jgi:NAD+ diphosphatase